MVKKFTPRVAYDKSQADLRFGPHLVYVRPDNAVPFRPDICVVEQDTWRVLGEQTRLRADDPPPWVLSNYLEQQPEVQPGSVYVKRQRPLILAAVVYDFDAEPVTCAAWIAAALNAVLTYAQQLGLSGLQLPLLGHQHGKFAAAALLDLLHDCLQPYVMTFPLRIHLQVADPDLCKSLSKQRQ